MLERPDLDDDLSSIRQLQSDDDGEMAGSKDLGYRAGAQLFQAPRSKHFFIHLGTIRCHGVTLTHGGDPRISWTISPIG